MKKEVIITAKTIDEAVDIGARDLGKSLADVSFEILEMPKRGLFGFGNRDARVRVYTEETPSDIAVAYIESIVKRMDLNAVVRVVSEDLEEIRINVTGEKLGPLIGHHGDVIDALQYLTFLAVNRGIDVETEDSENKKPSGIRIFLDVEDYRKKREETLSALAAKVAERVVAHGKPVTLEPMNSYERRIVHSVIQEIPGVSTYSIGQDHDRKIIVTKEGQRPPRNSPGKNPGGNRGGGRSGNRPGSKPARRESTVAATAEPDQSGE